MVYGLRDEIFLRLNYHIVLCIDLFLTSHGRAIFGKFADSFKYFVMLNEILLFFIIHLIFS